MEKQIWSIGQSNTVIVSDIKQNNGKYAKPNREDSEEINFYGGYLVCQSVRNLDNANLISAAPDLLSCVEEAFSIVSTLNIKPVKSLCRWQKVLDKAKGITEPEFENDEIILDALKGAKAVMDSQGINGDNRIVGSQYKKVIAAIAQLEEK
jgi:hypothetical protein